jgi:hypothetical protein
MRCKSGDVCLIISDQIGCKTNVGAYVTVTHGVTYPGYPPAWYFKDASRPIKGDAGDPPVRSTEEGFPSHEYALFDHHLLPIERPHEDADDFGITERAVLA